MCSWYVLLANDVCTSLPGAVWIRLFVLAGTVIADVPIGIRSYILTRFAEQDLEVAFWDAIVHVPGDDAHLDGGTLACLRLTRRRL